MNERIRQQVLAYFNGQLPPEEEEELVNWIKESEQNRNDFFQIRESLNPEKMEHPLLQESCISLKNRLLIDEEKRSMINEESRLPVNEESKLLIKEKFRSFPGKSTRKLLLSVPRVAALLLLALVLGFMLALVIRDVPRNESQAVWFETEVPRGEKSRLLLPDGSKVWLNSESSLAYPDNFMKGNRRVRLEGEAYFEVARQNGSVFTVGTADYDIRVLGTRFNVMAYPDFNRTETTLMEGRIEIQNGQQNIAAVPGQTVIFKDHQFSLETAKADRASKWKDDVFDFDGITFQELVVRLERWYDVDIEIKNPELNHVVYSGVFKNEETIDQVLSTLELTMRIHYTRKGFRNFMIE